MSVSAPEQSPPHLSLGITGHRERNAAFRTNRAAVEEALSNLLGAIQAIIDDKGQQAASVRFHSLLVDGVDQLAAELALARSWELVAPLPFGQHLNVAINAFPNTQEDARALSVGGQAADAEVEQRAQKIRQIASHACLFELADRDAEITALYLAWLADPKDFDKARAYEVECSDQVALAGSVMIERVDLLIAVWDRKARNLPGGTGFTVVSALEMGTPVLVIDPADPHNWSIYTKPEEIALSQRHGENILPAIIETAIGCNSEAPESFLQEKWHKLSSPLWTSYRRIEVLFDGEKRPLRNLKASYETPDQIPTGSAAALIGAALALPQADPVIVDRIVTSILPQFAWADGLSSWLSDAYRSGMCYNFILAAFAVIVGAAYLPLGLSDQKWIFASIELILLSMIVAITFFGSKKRWHKRWFETRRLAEYLRHGPIMLLLGVGRPTGRWPQAKGDNWPEHFARRCLTAVGLPRIALDRTHLRAALKEVIAPHVKSQRDYHLAKARRLSTVDHRLDKLAETFFIFAIISVSLYLLLRLGSAVNVLPVEWPDKTSKLFTFLGIACPTIGASIAGIRFFSDFERFSAISQVTAAKLGTVQDRIEALLAGSQNTITYAGVAQLVHFIDEIVVDEIESWQAVFGGKHIALPA